MIVSPLGIVAGRLAEMHGRPALMISMRDGEVAVGSGRSVPGFALHEALHECTELLMAHGGHAAAVFYGISLVTTALFFNAIWQYGRRRLLRADADPRVVLAITRSFTPGVVLYATATLVGLASAVASAALYAAIALFYVGSGERLVR